MRGMSWSCQQGHGWVGGIWHAGAGPRAGGTGPLGRRWAPDGSLVKIECIAETEGDGGVGAGGFLVR
jgi:hypothetical protein